MATKTTIKVGSNGLRLSIHGDHLTLKSGWRPGVRIDKADLQHLSGLLTLANGSLEALVVADRVLSGRSIDTHVDGQ